VGYETKTLVISSYQALIKLQISLKKDTGLLEAITVKPQENPAWPIVRKLLENADKHNPDKWDGFSVKGYSKYNLYAAFDYKNKGHKKQFPVPINNQLYENAFYLYSKAPNLKKEKVIATHTSFLKIYQTIFYTLPLDLHRYYFYEEKYNFYLMQRTFLSPINKSSLRNYEWMLLDSTLNQDSYFLEFKPLEDKTFNGFKGRIAIDKKDYAIKSMSCSAADSLLGFKINLKHDYAKTKGSWFPVYAYTQIGIVKDSLGGTANIYAKAETYFDSLHADIPPPKNIFDDSQREITPSANKQTDSSFSRFRIKPLTEEEIKIYKPDSSRALKRWNKIESFDEKYSDLFTNITSGIIPIKKWEFHIFNFIRVGGIQGIGINPNLRRSLLDKPRFGLSTAVGFGLKDKRMTYLFQGSWFLSKDRYHRLTAESLLDYKRFNLLNFDLGANLMYPKNERGQMPFNRAVLNTFKTNYNQTNSLSLAFKPFRYNQILIKVEDNKVRSFSKDFLNETPVYRTHELRLTHRLAYKEFINRNGRLESTFNRFYPIIETAYTKSINSSFTGYNYQSIKLNLIYQIRHKRIGQTDFSNLSYWLRGSSFPTDYLAFLSKTNFKTESLERIGSLLKSTESKDYVLNTFSFKHDFNNYLIPINNKYSRPRFIINQDINVSRLISKNHNSGLLSYRYYSNTLIIRSMIRVKIVKLYLGLGPKISFFYGPNAPAVPKDRWIYQIALF
jgi:hypothetical protein